MNALVDAALARGRTVVLLFLIILLSGSVAYVTIPKESEPDIAIPIIYVSMNHEGISPEDAERLLVRPMEQELRSIEGIKTVTSTASEGHASVTLEFFAGFDADRALDDVREKVDIAKSDLPADTEEPTVNEINVALFPVLTVSLSGPIPERSLVGLARDLRDRIEALPGVLEADIGGDREALLEVLVDPAVMETYGLNYADLLTLVRNNNLLVAPGAMDTGAGRLVLKVPGVVESLEDMLALPLKVDGDRVVTFADVATVRRSFKDPEGFARVGGQPAVTLEIKKRVGANIIDTVSEVRAIVEAEREHWPRAVEVAYMQDKSDDIRTMLGDLQNNILSAILLVMIIIIAALGPRSALLVGLAIPGSFLATMAILHAFGLTLNIVVLFSLILVVGMLVDGAIIVTELAQRNLSRGAAPAVAYGSAAKRMAWPIAVSTLTTLTVFAPLLFWPGVVGEFMKYLPLTVIVALSASLAMALVFLPVLGTSISRRRSVAPDDSRAPFPSVVARGYGATMAVLLRHPAWILLVALLAIATTGAAYFKFGKGVEFFPDVEPEFAQIQIHARGDLSIREKDAIVREVEGRILGSPELRSVYARSFNRASGENMAEDVVGVIQLEFIDWGERRPALEILDELEARVSDIPGVVIEFRKAETGPSGGKPIQVEVSSRDPARIARAVAGVRAVMEDLGGFTAAEDDRPLPGIEWRIQVDRERAARFGTDVATLGNAVQLITSGIRISGYRPEDSNDEVDIRARFPYSERNLGQLDQLRVPTTNGMVPIGNFVTLKPSPRTGVLKRVDGQRAMTVQSDVEAGLLVDDRTRALRKALTEAEPDPAVEIRFKGEDADQQEASRFLASAFIGAVLLMGLILVTLFNSVYQAVLVLSAIVFSTAGVLIGLMVTAQPFGIVMVGLGIIALAGIVVNNNIVLIDTYNRMRAEGLDGYTAALETGKLRLRPVFLTALTTVLGLMPMVLAMNLDLVDREITFGAPSTQWWTQLSSAIAGGLAFATLLTLILTPALLVLGDNIGTWLRQRFGGAPVLSDGRT